MFSLVFLTAALCLWAKKKNNNTNSRLTWAALCRVTWIWKYRAFGLPATNVWTWQCRYTRFQERHQLLTPIWLIPQKNLNYASLYCSFPDKMWYTFDCMSLVCFIFLAFSQFQCYTIVGWVIGWRGRLQFVKLLLHLFPASSSLVKPGLLDVTRKKGRC